MGMTIVMFMLVVRTMIAKMLTMTTTMNDADYDASEDDCRYRFDIKFK